MGKDFRRVICVAGVLLIAFIVMLSGCQKTEKALLSEFRGITQGEPSAAGLSKAASFLELHVPAVSEMGASRLVLAYEDYALRLLGSDNEIDSQAPLDEWFLILRDQGKIAFDYQALLDAYGTYVSEELQELLAIKCLEASDPVTDHAEIVQSYKDIIGRALKAEKLLKTHTNDDILRANTEQYYREYLFLLLAGSDHTPVFDYGTGQFSQDAKSVYEDFIHAEPDTVLADALVEYFSYLNSVNFVIDYEDAVENKIFFDTCNYITERALEKL